MPKGDSPVPDDLVGKSVADRFLIRRLVARGTMGCVYEAKQVPLGRRVAVKFLDVRAADDDEDTSDWVERFRREAASLAALTSPHTVRIIDYGWWEGRTYLVMEFIEGTLLADVLRDRPLQPARALDIALQVCDSLQEAHNRGLIHRDLKPDNILLTHMAKGREWAKVIDWGLVKNVDAEYTEAGTMLGTPSYMAPEQIRGEPVDGRADLYALGVVIFRMLTGRKPFEPRSTTAGVLLTHLQDPPIKLSEADPRRRFPPILDQIVERALEKRASDRYANAAEMAHDLEMAQRLIVGDDTPASGFRDLSGVRNAALSMSMTKSPGASRGGTCKLVGAVVAAVFAFTAAAAGAGYLAALLTADTGPERIEVAGSIRGHTTWTADKHWVLTESVFVEEGTLTIEAGTTVFGQQGAGLVVTRGATLRARGRADAPIVFTSARPLGERTRGDWGGVALLGSGPTNVPQPVLEGIDDQDPRGQYGGADATSSCGVLEYARIEFAGHEQSANNELNGLTLGACGSDTIVRYVQVHRALDDGVAVIGGSANLSHVVISSPGDDGLDWDQGWTGRAQFVVVQMGSDAGDHAIEADNAEDADALPRSAPQVSHLTLLGRPDPTLAPRAIVLRTGTAGSITNFVAQGFGQLVDIGDDATASLAGGGDLALGPGIVVDIEADYGWATAVRSADLEMPDAAFDSVQPSFGPPATSPAASGAAPLPDEEFWDHTATWLGAIRPGSERTWLDGWTAFPPS